MSDRPADDSSPENVGSTGAAASPDPTTPTESTGPTDPTTPTEMTTGPDPIAASDPTEEVPPAPRSDAPWWQQPHTGPAAWGGYGTPGPASHWPSSEPAAGGAQGDAGGTQGGYPQSGYPQGGYGSYGYGPGGPAGPSGPGGWHGGHWSGGPWGWGPSGGGWGPQQPATSGDRSRRKGLAAALGAGLMVLALLIGVGIGYGVWSSGSNTPASNRSLLPGGATSRSTFTTTSSATSSSGTLGTKVSSATGAPSDISTIRAKVEPELVDINTVLKYETEEAAGTGMVLTSTGKVLTNNHVIEGATTISVTDLGNKKTYSASVLGYTRTDDIAVIQLKGASGLKTVHLGNSSSVKVGEAIVGIGNAGGTGGEPSAAGGSVTDLDQSITASDEGSLGTTTEHLKGLIESNADIIPGDSGGPLVTTSGAVVGMDTAASEQEGYSFQGASTGQGYSIPINEAISTAHRIIAGKASTSVHIGGTAFLGVYVGSKETRSNNFGFGNTTTLTATTVPTTTTSGAVVEGVISGTPAEGSGLTQTDVITSIGTTAVTSPSGLMKIMLGYHPGDSVKVVWRTTSGQTETATITLATGPPD